MSQEKAKEILSRLLSFKIESVSNQNFYGMLSDEIDAIRTYIEEHGSVVRKYGLRDPENMTLDLIGAVTELELNGCNIGELSQRDKAALSNCDILISALIKVEDTYAQQYAADALGIEEPDSPDVISRALKVLENSGFDILDHIGDVEPEVAEARIRAAALADLERVVDHIDELKVVKDMLKSLCSELGIQVNSLRIE